MKCLQDKVHMALSLRHNFDGANVFAVANRAFLTQLFTVKCKHVSTSIYEQSQPAPEAGCRRDNMVDVGVSDATKIVEHCNFVQEYRSLLAFAYFS